MAIEYPADSVIVHVRGGVAEVVHTPHGIKVEILDFDNCSICGGADCSHEERGAR